MLKFGQIDLPGVPLLLAPMEDITDPSFRYMCKKFGADLMYTEFISSDGLIRDGRKSVEKLYLEAHERPIGIQLYGHLIAPMRESAVRAEKSNPDLIDLNFGCPVRKIAKRGAGAGMMRNVPLMKEMTRQIVDAVDIPVTAKTRLGWDADSQNVLEVALELQDAGIQALTIHGRTRAQMYTGVSDWSLIGAVKSHPDIHIPIIGNGDIDSGPVAQEMIKRYDLDAIMIGRASIGRPWIFREIKEYLRSGEIIPPPGVRERVEIAREHFYKSLEYKQGMRGIFEMRRHFSLYFKGIPHFKPVRMRLVTETDPDEILKILDEISENFGDVILLD